MFEEENKKGVRRPDFVSGDGVMVWTNQDKNGNPYLSVRIPLLNINVACFKVKEDKE